MPIRFHCPKCDQRLSVSGRKADTLVKCPSCKQTITVPTEEAAERAARARRAAKREPAAAGTASAGPSTATGAPAVKPPSIPPDPSGAPKSIGPPVEDNGDDDGSFIEFAVFDTSEEAAPSVSPSPNSPSKVHVTISRKVLYFQGALLAIVALVAFVLGLFAGRATKGPDGQEAFSEPITLRGRVTFENPGGDMLADDSSVIIAVPYDKRPTDDIPVDGIRPTDARPIPNHPGVAGIQVLQGGYARTSVTGEYTLTLPRGGRYWLMVISRNATTAAQPPKTHLAQIGRYFSSVSGLLGKQDYRWTEEFFKRNRTIDVKFERE